MCFEENSKGKVSRVIYVDDILVGFDRPGALEELRDAFQ